MSSAVPVLPRARRYEPPTLTLSFAYALALHVLLLALLGLLANRSSLSSPSPLELVIVGLTPSPQVTMGQVTPSAATPLHNPDATATAVSAPRTDPRVQTQEQQPRAVAEPVNPPLLTIAAPAPFAVVSRERAVQEAAARQQTAAQRQSGQPVATGPTAGQGINLPAHELGQVSATLQTAQGPVTVPAYVPAATPVEGFSQRPHSPIISHGYESSGTIVSARKLIYKELPPVPEWLQRQGVEPEMRFKVLILPDGSIARVDLIARSGGRPELDDAVRAAIYKWKYERGVGAEWRIIRVTYDLQ